MYDRPARWQTLHGITYVFFLLNKKNMNGISDTGMYINVCSTCSPHEQLCKVKQYVEGSDPPALGTSYIHNIHSFIDFIQAFHTPSRTCSWFTNLFNCSFNPTAESNCFIWAPATINTAATSYFPTSGCNCRIHK